MHGIETHYSSLRLTLICEDGSRQNKVLRRMYVVNRQKFIITNCKQLERIKNECS